MIDTYFSSNYGKKCKLLKSICNELYDFKIATKIYLNLLKITNHEWVTTFFNTLVS